VVLSEPKLEGDDRCEWPETVLEIGFGEGILSRWAAEAGARHVAGVDLSANMIELAQQTSKDFPNVHFHVCDAANLDAVLSEKFDVIIAVHVFCYATDMMQLQAMVRSAVSCLKVGGRIVGVRECITTRPSIDQSIDLPITAKQCCCACGPLYVGYTIDDLYPEDFCTCKLSYGNSDGSNMNFINYAVSEATMKKVFSEEGLHVVQSGTMLEWDASAPTGVIPDDMISGVVNDYGSLMWFFDCEG